jgi:hypothetical protein
MLRFLGFRVIVKLLVFWKSKLLIFGASKLLEKVLRFKSIFCWFFDEIVARFIGRGRKLFYVYEYKS